MRKRQYIAALACLVAGAIGFVGVYSTERAGEKKAKNERMAQEQQIEEKTTEEESYEASHVLLPEPEKPEPEPESETVTVEPNQEPEEVQPTIEQETLHFAAEEGLTWPVDGDVLLNYSMDSTIFFPTLQQYQYNPAIVIQGNVNDKVYIAAKGKITDISTNEVTGLTVTEDLGDGFSAVYGQLKEPNFEIGDLVEAGQVIGYVSEPTKYYASEGSNVYFELLKDGEPTDPFEYLE